ncbi:hypothetical protein LCGC14_2518920, partial [marine sediment metagenome]
QQQGKVERAGGRPVVLAGKRRIFKFGYADGQVEAVLPPGDVRIEVRKGFEYDLAEHTENLAADKTVTIKLKRWIDMPSAGWYSGDTHVHWVRHTWYENGDPAWLNVHSRAEDLWVNNNLILKHWWKNVKSKQFPRGLVANRPDMFGVGKVKELSVNGRIVWTGEEYRNNEVFGHMVFLRINKLIQPVSTGFMGGPEAVHYPPNSHTYDEVRQAGGISIAAHDVGKEVPLQVILGKLDSLDAHGTSRYYDLLNCGFRMPISIGSDYPANLMGFARVYVFCKGKLDYDTWVDNLAAGKTFVSSGAMITFQADGKTHGDTIELTGGKARDIAIKGLAAGRTPLARVEIVHNGKVVRTIKPAGGAARKIPFTESIRVSGPGWLAARTYAGSSPSWWGRTNAAHTAPIYIKAGSDRLIVPEAVRRLIRILQGARAAAAKSNMYASDKQKAEVLEYYDRGIRRYDQLLK